MKIYPAVLLFPSLLLTTSCLQEKIDRGTTDISQSWELDKLEVNGSNETAAFKASHNDYVIRFTEEGTFTEHFTDGLGLTNMITGTWFFQNNVKELKLEDDTESRFYEIIELNAARLTIRPLNITDEEIYYFESI